MRIENIAKSGAGAVAAALLSLLLPACGATNAVQTFIDGQPCQNGPTVWLIPDVSGSTATLRQPDGLYTQDVQTAITKTADACGTLYAGVFEGNGINTTWTINGQEFRQAIGGNTALGEAARAENAKQDLFPKIPALLKTREAAGSDILGVMSRVSDAAASLPQDQREQLKLILLTDGVLNLPGRYSLYNTPVDTPARRAKFITRLKASGEIPKLTGFDIYMAGLGVDVTDRETAKSIIQFWEELIPQTGARLLSTDASLRFP